MHWDIISFTNSTHLSIITTTTSTAIVDSVSSPKWKEATVLRESGTATVAMHTSDPNSISFAVTTTALSPKKDSWLISSMKKTLSASTRLRIYTTPPTTVFLTVLPKWRFGIRGY